MEELRVPNFAGICTNQEAIRTGITVDENVTRLKRYNYVKTKLFEIMVKHMNATEEWEVKGGFSLHIWIDAEHVTMLRKRVSEMRQPPLQLDKVPDPKLEEVMHELLSSQSTLELLTGMYEVIRPALLDSFRNHLNITNTLADHPTCRMLKFLIQEEEEMIQWGKEALKALTTPETEGIKHKWKSHIQEYLHYAKGVAGNNQLEEGFKAPTSAGHSFVPTFIPKRDNRFKDTFNSVTTADKVYLDPSHDAKERMWALLYKRLREIDVPEMQCSIVAETEGKPWEYYHDMGRQIWDEARHSMMGEAAFNHNQVKWWELPIRVNFSYELNTLLAPQERHAILYDIEFGLMPADKGKKFEWEIAKQSGYSFATTIQDYDWADEVLHAQIGRKWIVKELGGVEETLEIARQAYKKLEEKRPVYVNVDPKWWENFYQKVKDKEFPS